MVARLLLLYAVVELAVTFALVSTIGWGWTLLVLLATFLLGWGVVAPMAGSQLLRRIGQLRSGLTEPRAAAGDGALLSLATALVLIPGLLSRKVASSTSRVQPQPIVDTNAKVTASSTTA